MDRRKGSILILAVFLTLLVGGLTAGVLSISFASQKTAKESMSREMAFRAAESGMGYYLVQVLSQSTYFATYPAPHAAKTTDRGSFQLVQSQQLTGNQWELRINGSYDGVTYSLNGVVGPKRIRFPNGIVVVGTGDPSDVVFNVAGGSDVGSYNPAAGAYDPSDPDDHVSIGANGSLNVSGSSTVYGDVTSSGTVSEDAGSDVTGTVEENAPSTEIDDIDPIVTNAVTSSKAANNNAALAAIFGAQWSPVAGPENYGNLIINTPGTYVIPAGTYRFRRFEVHNGANVIFDTSGGPSKLVYVGAGKGTGIMNDLIVDGASSVKINPNSTTNGLLTVLGPDCDFKVSGSSVFGQAIGDTNNSGYSQIISLGGDTSSDDIVVSGGSTVYGRLYAASHLFNLGSNSTWYGSALARTITLAGSNSTFAVDEGTTGNVLIDPTDVAILARWPANP